MDMYIVTERARAEYIAEEQENERLDQLFDAKFTAAMAATYGDRTPWDSIGSALYDYFMQIACAVGMEEIEIGSDSVWIALGEMGMENPDETTFAIYETKDREVTAASYMRAENAPHRGW